MQQALHELEQYLQSSRTTLETGAVAAVLDAVKLLKHLSGDGFCGCQTVVDSKQKD